MTDYFTADKPIFFPSTDCPKPSLWTPDSVNLGRGQDSVRSAAGSNGAFDKNGWLDDAGRVYIIFTTEEIMTSLYCADKKATQTDRAEAPRTWKTKSDLCEKLCF